MLTESYSKRYAIVQQNDEHSKELALNQQKSDVIARAKKLSVETNKRRRALEIKRKNEDQNEEKRRQNILARRREIQRDATEKYQRAHLPTRPSSNHGYTSPTYGLGVLEQTLRHVRGASPSARRGSTKPLEQSVRYASNGTYHKDRSEALYNRYNSPQRPLSPTDRVKEYSRSVSIRNELHNKSLRNLNSSRTLFEKQLKQHQQKMIEQQKQSEWAFNFVVMNKIDSDKNIQGITDTDENSSRSASLSSHDSLEEAGTSLQSLQEETKKVVPSNFSAFQVEHPTTEVVKEQVSQTNSRYQQTHALPPKPQQHKYTSVTMPESLKSGSIYRKYSVKVTQRRGSGIPVKLDKSQHVAPTQSNVDVMPGNTRPKVQRAWATPSVNQGHSQALPASTNTLTNASLYSARNTITSVTTITAFNKGLPNHVQAQTSIPQNVNGNVEILQTVANDLPNINGEMRVVKPDKVTNQSEANHDSTGVVHLTKEIIEESSEKTHKDNKSNTAIIEGTSGLVNGRLAVLPNKFPPKPPESKKDFCHMQINRTEGLDLAGVNADSRENSKAEEGPTLDHVGVKGILKHPGSSKKADRTLKKAGSTGSINENFKVEDSLEVAKQHLQQEVDGKSHQTPQKKCVRFADLCLEDDIGHIEDSPEHSEERLFIRRNKKPLTVSVKPMRPMSAKPSSGSSRMESPGCPVRITSANLPRQATIRPQAAAHIITCMSSENSTNHAQTDQMREKKITAINNFMDKVPLMGQNVSRGTAVPAKNHDSTNPNTQAHIQIVACSKSCLFNVSHVPSVISIPSYPAVNGQPVYNENGLRIDRTPTDDKNNMWDNMRTSLDKITPDADQQKDNCPVPARQTMVLSQKYIDGAALDHLNTSSRVFRTQPVSSHPRKPGVPEQNNTYSYSRRYGLLQQRKQQQQNPNEVNKNVQKQRQNIMYHSNGDPKVVPHPPAQKVSGNLLAFVMAEKLSQQSSSNNHIHQEINSLHNNQHVDNNGPMTYKVTEPKVPNNCLSPSQQHVRADECKGHSPLNTCQRRPGTASAHRMSKRGQGLQY